MSITNLAQHEQYLKSLEHCLEKIDDQYEDIYDYMRASHQYLRIVQKNIRRTDILIKECREDSTLLKALVDELRSTRFDFEEPSLH